MAEGKTLGFLRHWKGWKHFRDLPSCMGAGAGAGAHTRLISYILPTLPTLPDQIAK